MATMLSVVETLETDNGEARGGDGREKRMEGFRYQSPSIVTSVLIGEFVFFYGRAVIISHRI